MCFVALFIQLLQTRTGSGSSSTRLCAVTEERTRRLRFGDSYSITPARERHGARGTRQDGADETRHGPTHSPSLQSTADQTRDAQPGDELGEAPVRPLPAALGRASHELPWSSVPAAVAPILTRAGVRLLRPQTPPPSHTLKKGQPSAVLPSLHTHHGCPARLLCHKTPCDHHPLNSRFRGRQLHTPQPQWIPICVPSSTCC